MRSRADSGPTRGSRPWEDFGKWGGAEALSRSVGAESGSEGRGDERLADERETPGLVSTYLTPLFLNTPIHPEPAASLLPCLRLRQGPAEGNYRSADAFAL